MVSDRSGAQVALPVHRLLWVMGFAMGPYACMERTWKPFNPILGETFELEHEGIKFFAEQVRSSASTMPRDIVSLSLWLH
jgi:hypothetical protein